MQDDRVWRTRRALRGIFLLAMVVMLALAPSLVAADEHWQQLRDDVRSGRIMPLQEILDRLLSEFEGEVLEVELEREDGRMIYEVELIGAKGQIVEFELDGATGQIIGIEGVDIDAMRR